MLYTVIISGHVRYTELEQDIALVITILIQSRPIKTINFNLLFGFIDSMVINGYGIPIIKRLL
jgi:ABC-type uncharacterized transport system permease subunit